MKKVVHIAIFTKKIFSLARMSSLRAFSSLILVRVIERAILILALPIEGISNSKVYPRELGLETL